MKLVIAEKPKMGKAIAAVIGATSHRNGYMYGNGYIVTSAIGHLVELCQPEEYNDKWKSWNASNLPMIPDEFRYRVSEGKKQQFELVKNLLLGGEVTEVINACDPGREGELIFHLIYKLAGANLPVQRLWVSTLTPDTISKGFEQLQPGDNYLGLRAAALLRQIADWLIGLNSTQAQTCVARDAGGKAVYSLGRVQTPTLCLVVWRDREVEQFTPVSYFEIKANFKTAGGETFAARLFDSATKQIKKFASEAEAKNTVAALLSAPPATIVSLSEKQGKTNSPSLFDLTLLQRTANTKFGLTAARTLEIAQKLYETGILTYPRTQCAFLSRSDADQAQNVVPASFNNTEYESFAREIVANGYVINPKKIDDTKVKEHPAILPTGAPFSISRLDAQEKLIYDLVVRRFLASFYPAAEDLTVSLLIRLGDAFFATKGKTESSAGWRAVEREEKPELADDDDAPIALPKLEKGESLTADSLKSLSKQTRPPAKLNESLLLQAMETAGKYVKNDEMREAMKENGLGTPATRAAIIEKLIDRGYMVREKKNLRSTTMGREIVSRLEGCQSLLASPALTGQWEAALGKIERGDLQPERFKQSVLELTRTTVEQILAQSQGANNDFAATEGIAKCPKCVTAQRSGTLVAKSKDGRKYVFCSMGREVCGYFSDLPTKKKHVEKWQTEKCPVCSGVLTFGLTREKQMPVLRCATRACKGIVWLEKPKKEKTAV